MELTREQPGWSEAVYQAVRGTVSEAGFGEELRISPIASWLDGFFLHIVYRKLMVYREQTVLGLFGFRYDTRLGITGTDWAEPETIGREIVMYGLWEPHAPAPARYVETGNIYWLGDIRTGLPTVVAEIPAFADRW